MHGKKNNLHKLVCFSKKKKKTQTVIENMSFPVKTYRNLPHPRATKEPVTVLFNKVAMKRSTLIALCFLLLILVTLSGLLGGLLFAKDSKTSNMDRYNLAVVPQAWQNPNGTIRNRAYDTRMSHITTTKKTERWMARITI